MQCTTLLLAVCVLDSRHMDSCTLACGENSPGELGPETWAEQWRRAGTANEAVPGVQRRQGKQSYMLWAYILRGASSTALPHGKSPWAPAERTIPRP